MGDHPAKALKDELIRVLSNEKGEIAQATKSELKTILDSYYSELLKDAKEEKSWKDVILKNEKKQITDKLGKKDVFQEETPTQRNNELIATVESSYRWIVPIPPDPAVVAYVIARDRANAEAEKAKNPDADPVNTWVAAEAGNWSVDGNWSLGHVPDSDETATFDNTSVNNCTANSATESYGWDIKATYSGTVAQGTNDIYIGVGGFAMAGPGPTFTGATTNVVKCGGGFTKTGGTLTANVLNLAMTAGGTFVSNNDFGIRDLTVNDDTVMSSSITVRHDLTIDDDISLSISADKTLNYLARYNLVTGTFANSGTVDGSGTIVFFYQDGVPATEIVFGNIAAPTSLALAAGAGASRTAALTTDTTFLSTLTVYSLHATRTMALDLNGHSLQASGLITASTRGIISSSVAGAKIKSGNITVSANGTLDNTNISQIDSDGTIDTSAGTLTTGTERWVLAGNGKTIKLAAGQKFYDLITRGHSNYSLLSNITVDNEYVSCSPIRSGAYAITLTDATKWYDRYVLHPVITNPKKRIIRSSDYRMLRYLGDDIS